MLNNGKEAWDIELTDGLLDTELSVYYPDISTEEAVPLTELPQYLTLPAFDNITADTEVTEKAVFYAPLKLMAYRDGWYELITAESMSVNGDFVTREEFDDFSINTDNRISFNSTLGETALKVYNKTSKTTETIDPIGYYDFGEVESLTLDFFIYEDLKPYRNEFAFTFISGETPTVLTLPSSVQWVNELTVEANKRYEISIVDNIGLWCAVDYTAEVSG
ncbi:MAG: hypothetical protein IJA87_02140 [Clostridia bacterium]|nr:hypothetical protein [Clostridia bacterium]